MRKGIILTLVGLLLIAFLAGCGGYRQRTVTEPNAAPHRVVPRDGVHRRHGVDGAHRPHRRHDGHRANEGVHRRHDGHRANEGVHRRHDGHRANEGVHRRHDGRVTELYPRRSHEGRIGADGHKHYRDGIVTNRDTATGSERLPKGRAIDGVGRGIWRDNYNLRSPATMR